MYVFREEDGAISKKALKKQQKEAEKAAKKAQYKKQDNKENVSLIALLYPLGPSLMLRTRSWYHV